MIIEASYCPTCEQDTLPVNDLCLWCSCNVVTGLVDERAAHEDRLARERGRMRVNSAAYRARQRPGIHQVPE